MLAPMAPARCTCGHATLPPAHRLPAVVAMAKKKAKGGAAKGGMVEVVLTAEVKGVGKKGQLVSVKPAYAENMLVRAGLGVMASPEVLEKFEADKAAAEAAAIALKEAAVANDAKLCEVFKDGVVVKKKTGEGGKIFGSVTPTEVNSHRHTPFRAPPRSAGCLLSQKRLCIRCAPSAFAARRVD